MEKTENVSISNGVSEIFQDKTGEVRISQPGYVVHFRAEVISGKKKKLYGKAKTHRKARHIQGTENKSYEGSKLSI